jgi:glycosidase
MKYSKTRGSRWDAALYHFHISRVARDLYNIDAPFYSLMGNVIIANLAQARVLSAKINDARVKANRANEQVTPGLVNAAALFHEIYHYVIREYEEKQNPGVLSRTLNHLMESVGEDEVHKLLISFITHFPPLPVYHGVQTAEQFLAGRTESTPNKEMVFEELLLLHLENFNPALNVLKELFDEAHLQETVYAQVIDQSARYFELEKPVGNGKDSLLAFLKKPILQHPDSIEQQLKFIHENWNISEAVILKILSASDLIYEDSKLFLRHGDKGGTPPVPVYKTLTAEELQRMLREQAGGKGKFVSLDEVSSSYLFEEEQFTQDTDWMPRVVMMAKNTFVWLDQLSKKYGRPIKTLDQIPDEELNDLRDWHFNSLWLIGVWERSQASKKVKQFCGNHDAVASAYSLFDYEIAYALGGYPAYENLRDRCKARGIKLASDMVPNHTGIYSRWTIEHPDYFIQNSYPPYPGYSFTGPDLSDSEHLEIRVEDKYYSRQDAAVVFELKHKADQSKRYIYHGNDGTNMPWNDTAQLNLLKPEVREALYQKIKHVAEMFPIIRFDAAMTLAKRHYQRLWFPQPGTGGAVPSRADFALTKEMFDEAMPNEFWREVVDRMNAEMPDTLLLAEAFWLMEGYFVRTLGMHRVYNSAFMHMFMKEENQKYRELIKNTLEFNPEILKRYVNFMSNPDEETAINQFGKGDKYFGVCAMLVTLPGLPMFAHGQIEGFTEKYGMEYQRAYYNEVADQYLIDRHRREIFPLTLKRAVFSDVRNFWFYDFVAENGNVNQNVFAFTNVKGGERSLTLYNNCFERSKGKIHYTTGKVVGDAQTSANPELIYSDFASALRLQGGDNVFYICKEYHAGLEYLFSGRELQQNGFSTRLDGYEYKVYLDFREVIDTDGRYFEYHRQLNGHGVPSVEQALRELRTAPLHAAINELFNEFNLSELKRLFTEDESGSIAAYTDFSPYLKGKYFSAVHELQALGYATSAPQTGLQHVFEDLKLINEILPIYFKSLYTAKNSPLSPAMKKETLQKFHLYIDLAVIFNVIYNMLSSVEQKENQGSILDLYEELYLAKPLWQNFIRLHNRYEDVRAEFELLRILLAEFPVAAELDAQSEKGSLNRAALISLLNRADMKNFIGYNVFDGVAYFNKERLEVLLQWYVWMKLLALGKHEYALALQGRSTNKFSFVKKTAFRKEIEIFASVFHAAYLASVNSEYKYETLLTLLHEKAPKPVKPVAAKKKSAPKKTAVPEKPKSPNKSGVVKKTVGTKKSTKVQEKKAAVQSPKKGEKSAKKAQSENKKTVRKNS